MAGSKVEATRKVLETLDHKRQEAEFDHVCALVDNVVEETLFDVTLDRRGLLDDGDVEQRLRERLWQLMRELKKG